MKWKIMAVALSLFVLGGCSFENIIPEDLLMTVQNQEPVRSSQYQYEDVTQLKVAVGEETLNPYEMVTDTSLRVVPLLYDSLVKLDLSYGYDFCVASSVQLEGTACLVTLKDNVFFSDGTALTTADVMYSYRQAVNSQNQYTGLFSNVESVTVIDERQIRFNLISPDVLFTNLLTFPILQSGSSDQPVGSGRYYLSGEGKLSPNPHWYGGDVGKIQSIQLVQQPNRETCFYSMKVGGLDYLFVDGDGTQIETGGSVHYVPMPNLLYVGIRDGGTYLSDPLFRQMLAATVDSEAVVESAYYDRALPTTVPFPANWGKLADVSLSMGPDYEKVQSLLAQLGLDNRDEEGYIIKGMRRVSLEILVNGDNAAKTAMAEALSQSLDSVGLSVTVTALPFDQYEARVLAGQYDLYIGEIKLKNNLDLASLFTVQLQLFGEENLQTLEVYDQWRQGMADLPAFLDSFAQSVPFIPLGTRNGAIYYNRAIYYELNATSQDVFYNIRDW